jgi:cytochrome c
MKMTRTPGRIAATAAAGLFAIIAVFTLPELGKAEGAARGKEVFEKRCGGCHSLDRDKEGPRLRGVYGRAAASVETFKYSDALKKARVTWNAESLDSWLQDPDKVAPDNDMAFHLPSSDERRAVIAYLKELGAK